MSRARTRARNRRARTEEAQREFARARHDPQAFSELLDRLAASDIPVWPIAEAASVGDSLSDDERAMIAQAVAPHLSGMMPGSIHRRYALGEPSVVVSGVTSQPRKRRPETGKGGGRHG